MRRAAHAARNQVLARAQACLCDPGFQRVASLLGEFEAYRLLGPLPTLLERDFNIPPMPELLQEVQRVQAAQAAVAVETQHA